MVNHFVTMYPCMSRNQGNTDVVLFLMQLNAVIDVRVHFISAL